MSLTATDLEQIATAVSDITSPRFDASDSKSEKMFAILSSSIESLAVATGQQFDSLSKDISALRDDLIVVKEFVKDHSFRIAKLEHRPG